MLARLHLRDFRNYEEAVFEPSAVLTVLHGDNGQGKTNLLEALCVLSSGASPRAGGQDAIVRYGSDAALARARVETGGRPVEVSVEMPRTGRMRCAVNGTVVRRRSDALGLVRCVLFSPDDLELVKGGPAGRRDYMDTTAALLRPVAADRLAGYERVVRQRTALLRATKGSARQPATLATWTEKLVLLGLEVQRDRLAVLADLAPLVAGAHDTLVPAGAPLELSYRTSWNEERKPGDGPDERALRAALADVAGEERERAQCLAGPHRDDLVLALGGRDTRTSASQGEARTIALALRLAVHTLATGPQGPPLLLLDDVVSELDPHRREALLARLPAGQAIITTADPPGRLPLPPGALMVEVRAGRVLQGNGRAEGFL